MKVTGKRWTHLALYLGLVWAAAALVVPRAYRIGFGHGLGFDVNRLPAVAIGAAAMVSVLAVGVAPVGHVVAPPRRLTRPPLTASAVRPPSRRILLSRPPRRRSGGAAAPRGRGGA